MHETFVPVVDLAVASAITVASSAAMAKPSQLSMAAGLMDAEAGLA